MIELPELPEGSAMRATRGQGVIRLSWLPPADKATRRRGVISISLTLVIFGFVLSLIARDLMASGTYGDLEIFVGFVALLAALAVYGLYRLDHPSVEAVVLEAQRLRFRGGVAAQDFFLAFGVAIHRGMRKIRRDRIDGIALSEDGDDLRVEFSYRFLGNPYQKELVIGRHLSAADRAWLAEVLRRWRDAGREEPA